MDFRRRGPGLGWAARAGLGRRPRGAAAARRAAAARPRRSPRLQQGLRAPRTRAPPFARRSKHARCGPCDESVTAACRRRRPVSDAHPSSPPRHCRPRQRQLRGRAANAVRRAGCATKREWPGCHSVDRGAPFWAPTQQQQPNRTQRATPAARARAHWCGGWGSRWALPASRQATGRRSGAPWRR